MKYLYKNRFVIALLHCIDAGLSVFPKKRRAVPSEWKKILVIKPDHLGDCLLATSVFPLLGNKIDVVCSKNSWAIFENNPFVDKCFFLEHPMLARGRKRWLSFVLEYIRLAWRLRQEKYDLCLILRAYGGNLITLAWLAGAKCLIGHKTAGFGPLLDVAVEWKEGVHEVDHFLEVLAPLGNKAVAVKPEMHPTETDREYVSSLVGEMGEFIAVHPFAGDRRKMIPMESWKKFIKDSALPVLVCGSAGDELLGEGIDLRGKLNLRQMMLLFQKAKAVYTLDSVSAHIAAISNENFHLIYHPELFSDQWRPLSNKVKKVSAKLFCID